MRMYNGVGALTAGLLLAVTVTACGTETETVQETMPSGTPEAVEDQAPAAAPALSVDQAQAVLEEYAEVNDQANEALDADLIATVEAGPLLQRSHAGMVALRARPESDRGDVVPTQQSNPRYYIPAGVQGWWMAEVTRQGGQELLTFADVGEGEWRMVSSLTLDEPLPDIELDEEGWATAVDLADAAGAIAPAEVPGAYEDLWETGAKEAGAVLAETPATEAALEERRANGGDLRLLTRFVAEQPEHPEVYALRTADGGSLVVAPLARQRIETSIVEGSVVTPGTVTALYDDTPRNPVNTYFRGDAAVWLPAGDEAPRVLAAESAATDAD
ncbi:hypothetical protein [Streptomyces sp. G-5]|uniref:hypothetical protein n=1 Tax=Streptomyces sp. G-5 TaxID=2977231 RepID=UPI0021CFE6D9|nr:hypothetical protein [Streptomyces sp. G-5]MCU4750233.1 hypothetical protein [Streptomyces sp. G-5]